MEARNVTPLGWMVFVMVAACGGDGGGGSGTPCTGPTDCPAAEVCVNGACETAPTCECEAGQFCATNGACIPDGTCATNGDCTPGMICDPSSVCVPGGECGATEVSITPVPPNLLVVLDRSCSMRSNVAGTPKWTAAVGAINQLTTGFTGDIRWGLSLFPDITGDSCGQDTISVPVAAGTEASIQGLLTASLATSDPNYPDGPCVTNIDSAMRQAAAEPALDDPTRQSFVMLITDGMQAGCSLAGGDDGTERIIRNLNTMRDVKTFVVGFGGGEDQAQMDAFAVAGSTALGQSPRYYRAGDAAALETALGDIADLVIGCDFALTDPPEDIAGLYAFFNNLTSVPRDPGHLNGWDYDPATMTLTFYGGFCDQLSSGAVTDVDIVYGCAGPTPD